MKPPSSREILEILTILTYREPHGQDGLGSFSQADRNELRMKTMWFKRIFYVVSEYVFGFLCTFLDREKSLKK